MVEHNLSDTRISELLKKKSELREKSFSTYLETLIFVAILAYFITQATWLVYLVSVVILAKLIETLVIKYRFRQYNQEIKTINGNRDKELNKNLDKEIKLLNFVILVSILQILLILSLVFL